MVFVNLVVEFVRVEMNDIATISCNLETTSDKPSGEDCIGCDAPMNNCPGIFVKNGKETRMTPSNGDGFLRGLR